MTVIKPVNFYKFSLDLTQWKGLSLYLKNEKYNEYYSHSSDQMDLSTTHIRYYPSIYMHG